MAAAVQQRRTKATTNRTKRALNVVPHPSFFLNGGSGGRGMGDLESEVDGIMGNDNVVIFNPPSSEASVYHTPFKFLPKSDPRRRANMAALFEASTTLKFPSAGDLAGSSSSGGGGVGGLAKRLPHVHQTTAPAKRQVTAEEVAEMRQLRSENPVLNSVQRLSVRYNCSKLFVMIATGNKGTTEHKALMARQLEKAKARWGPTKTKARADRYKRTEMLYRGEL